MVKNGFIWNRIETYYCCLFFLVKLCYSRIIMSKKVERRLVWSSWLRISHGLIAISTLALMLTSWLSKHAATLTAASSDYHVMSGTALLLGLLLRMWLLFTDKQSAGVAAMIPTRTSLQGVVPMIKFHLSLGKTPSLAGTRTTRCGYRCMVCCCYYSP